MLTRLDSVKESYATNDNKHDIFSLDELFSQFL